MVQFRAEVEAAPSAVALRLLAEPFGPSQYRSCNQGLSQGSRTS